MNILDTRDLNERLEELEQEEQDLAEEEQAELAELRDLKNEIPEWDYGNTLIPVDDWEEYVEELLKSIGDLPQDIPHYIAVDWATTAENIAQDYALADYQGADYYYRNC